MTPCFHGAVCQSVSKLVEMLEYSQVFKHKSLYMCIVNTKAMYITKIVQNITNISKEEIAGWQK